ncbi:hypothetical protein J3R82DRAFT_7280 [Butyriboletus roseoflavus]|nr:hypothetical protein J3R82DRAFT_7280 [Butyriboletus roseoflavus]
MSLVIDERLNTAPAMRSYGDDGRRLNHLGLQPHTLRARGQGQQLWLGICACTKEVRAQSLILARQIGPPIDSFCASSQLPRNMGLPRNSVSNPEQFINLISSVIGTTGSGKSTVCASLGAWGSMLLSIRFAENWIPQFINLVSGSTLSVSDGLRSCTSEVLESRPFSLDDQSIALIDTPGFDDTTRVDTDIITTMSTYLANM